MTLHSSSQLALTRDIIVCLTEESHGDEAADALAYALSLVGMAGAHLTVQSAARRLTIVTGRAWGTSRILLRIENRRLRSLAQALAKRSVSDAASTGVTCTAEAPILAYPDLIARLTARARLADLTILDAEARGADLDCDLIDETFFRSGRLVIVVPSGWNDFRAHQDIIAWDGSAQTVRGANNALPFLRAATA